MMICEIKFLQAMRVSEIKSSVILQHIQKFKGGQFSEIDVHSGIVLLQAKRQEIWNY